MMRLRTALPALALALSISLSPVTAQDLSATGLAGLNTRITQFEQAFQEGDLQEVSSVIPPKVMAAMADQFGMDPADLTLALAQAMETAMAAVTLHSYKMDVDRAKTAVSRDGRPYLLIPTTTVMTAEGTKMQANSETLAFADDDVWFLVRIDDAQQTHFLTLAYPEFKGVDFPTGSIEILED